jgi:hypothetical protein
MGERRCRAASGRFAELNVLRLLEMSYWLLQQEDLIAGVTFAPLIARTIEDSLLKRYHIARTTQAPDTLANLLLREGQTAVGRTGSTIAAASTCDTGKLPRDGLCLMQSNPLVATNVLQELVTRRLRTRFGVDWTRGLDLYEAAMQWHDDRLLREVLGEDLFFQVGDAESSQLGGSYRWQIELPRVFVGTDSTDPPKSAPPCQADLLRSNDATRDELPGVRVAWNPKWAICYDLPSADVLRPTSPSWYGEWSRRPNVAGALQEIWALQTARAELRMSSTSASRRTQP